MHKRNVWTEITALLLLGLSPLVIAAPPGGPGMHAPPPAAMQQRIPYQGEEYVFSEGRWYRPHGTQLRPIVAPPGLRVRTLPGDAREIWIGSVLYHLAAGTYYLWRAESREYEVVSPPVVASQATRYDVIAYPARGQNEEQQGRDRYECHRWAVTQSGFDPAAASTAPSAEVGGLYQRALGACLSGRGYSIS